MEDAEFVFEPEEKEAVFKVFDCFIVDEEEKAPGMRLEDDGPRASKWHDESEKMCPLGEASLSKVCLRSGTQNQRAKSR